MFDAQPAHSCPGCRFRLGEEATLDTRKEGYTFLRCPSCRSVTIAPLPTPAQLTAFYQNYHGSRMYGGKEEAKIRRARRRIERFIGQADGRRFLDVGCNNGYAVKAALDLGWGAHGIDVDADTLAAAAVRFGTNHFTACTVEDYAQKGHQADVIYTSEVIEHVPDPDAFVDALRRLLSFQGTLFLTTPDAGHFRVPRRFVTWNAVKPPLHIHYFTREGMWELLRRHGFAVEKFLFSLKPQMKLVARKRF